MKAVAGFLAYVVGEYLVVRTVAALVVIDCTHSPSFRDNWGGLSLSGVLLVHRQPGGGRARAHVVGMATLTPPVTL